MDRYAKAVVALLVAGLTALAAALIDDNAITTAEWIGAAIAALGTTGAVWATPNKTD